jgi:uncharacterized protein (DUF1330 family)
MPAYAVFIRDRTLDPRELQTYRERVGPTFTGHPFRTLAAYGPQEDLEGPPTEGTVILEFPSMEAAKAWYDSPAYREVREHRLTGAVYRVVLVQGV